MAILYRLAKKIFPDFFRGKSKDTLERYLFASRIAYFFTASTLCIYVVKMVRDYDRLEKLEAGIPVIDKTSTLKSDRGLVVYEYRPGVGVLRTEYDSRQLYNKMEQEALEKARQAQEKLLEQGKKLPPEAIRLVD